MPFIQQEAAGGQFGSLASGMGALAQAMFPDPARAVNARLAGAQADLAGAQTVETQQKTGDLQRAAAARAGLGGVFGQAALNPNAANLAALSAEAAKLGIDPKTFMAPALASNATGGPGATTLPALIADRASTLSGTAGTFAGTQSGQQVTEAGNTARQNSVNTTSIATNKYTNDTSTDRQRIATEPQLMQQRREDRAQGAKTMPYVTGSSTSGTGLANLNVPVEQLPPPNAIPLNVQQPDETARFANRAPPPVAGLTGIIRPGAPTPATSAPSAPAVNSTAPTGPAETQQQQQAANAAQPGVTPHAVPAPEQAAPGQPVLGPQVTQLATNAYTPNPVATNAGEARRFNNLFGPKLETYNKENPGGLWGAMTGHQDYDLSADLRSRITQRAADYFADRNNVSLAGKVGPSFDKAWSDFVPTATQENHSSWGRFKNSMLRFGADAKNPGQKPAAGQAPPNQQQQPDQDQDQSPAQFTASQGSQPPAPTTQAPPSLSQSMGAAALRPPPVARGPAVSNRSLDNGPTLPGLPPPSQRVTGHTYTVPGRGDFIWMGQGFVPVPGTRAP